MWLVYVVLLLAGLSAGVTWNTWNLTKDNNKYVTLLGTILLLSSVLVVLVSPEYQINMWSGTMIALGLLLSGTGWWYSTRSRPTPTKRGKSAQEILLIPQQEYSISKKDELLKKLRSKYLSDDDRLFLINQLEQL